MPEFILDHGSSEATREFKALSPFVQGYIEAAFFTSTGPDNVEEGLEHGTVAEIASEALAKIVAEKSLQELRSKRDVSYLPPLVRERALLDVLMNLAQYTGGWDSPEPHPCAIARETLKLFGRVD